MAGDALAGTGTFVALVPFVTLMAFVGFRSALVAVLNGTSAAVEWAEGMAALWVREGDRIRRPTTFVLGCRARRSRSGKEAERGQER